MSHRIDPEGIVTATLRGRHRGISRDIAALEAQKLVARLPDRPLNRAEMVDALSDLVTAWEKATDIGALIRLAKAERAAGLVA